MALTLIFGEYTFERMPAIQPKLVFETFEDKRESALIRETWMIEGSLTCSGSEALQAKWDSLVAACKKTNQMLRLLEGNIEIYKADPKECLSGPTVQNLDVIDSRAGYLATNIRFSLSIEMLRAAFSRDAEGLLAKESTIEYSFDIFGYVTITERGKASSDKEITKAPLPTISPSSKKFTVQSSLQLSESKRACSFSFTWTELRAPFPEEIRAAIGSFSLSVSEQQSEDFLYSICKVSGNCKLKRSSTAIQTWGEGWATTEAFSLPEPSSVLPVSGVKANEERIGKIVDFLRRSLIADSMYITAEDITSDFWEGSVSFSFEFLKPGSSNLAKFEYSMTLKEPALRLNFVERYGTLTVMQTLGYSSAEITEEGEIVHFGHFPNCPIPYFRSCSSRSFSRKKPTFDSKGNVVLAGISFSFSYAAPVFSWKDIEALSNYRFTEARGKPGVSRETIRFGKI